MKVKIDKDLCTVCGLCSQTCPDIFETTDSETIAKVETVPANLEDCAKQAASECPTEAIKIS